MNKLTIESKIVPKMYFKFKILDKKKTAYGKTVKYKKYNEIIYDIFIEDLLINSINKDILSIIKKDYLNINIDSMIYQITTEKQLENVYKYNCEKYIYTVFNIVNLKQSTKYMEHIINADYNMYLKKFFIRYHAMDFSYLMRTKTQIARINKYQEILNQLFRFKKGYFKMLSNDILNIIFKNMIELEPNLGFIYINCVSSDILTQYIKAYEKNIYEEELIYKYNDDISDMEEID